MSGGLGSVQFSPVAQSCPTLCDPHEPQHTRPPCPSPTPGVHPNPCPLSPWCHPTIASSVILFSSCPQSFPASGSFQMSQLFAWGGQSIGVSVLVRNIKLTSYHRAEEFGKGPKEASHVIPTSQNPPRWYPSWLSNVCALRKDPESECLARPYHHKTWDSEPHGRAVLLHSFTLLLSAQVPLPNKVTCFVSMRVCLLRQFLS